MDNFIEWCPDQLVSKFQIYLINATLLSWASISAFGLHMRTHVRAQVLFFLNYTAKCSGWIHIFVCVHTGCIWRVLLKCGLDWKTEWKTEWKMEQKMEKYQIHINLIIFSFFPEYTLSVSFRFAGKVQQCLVTGFKWNIFVTNS